MRRFGLPAGWTGEELAGLDRGAALGAVGVHVRAPALHPALVGDVEVRGADVVGLRPHRAAAGRDRLRAERVRPRAHEASVVVGRVGVPSHRELPLVAHAPHRAGQVDDLAERREHQRDDDREDGDHHQQFGQGEAATRPVAFDGSLGAGGPGRSATTVGAEGRSGLRSRLGSRPIETGIESWIAPVGSKMPPRKDYPRSVRSQSSLRETGPAATTGTAGDRPMMPDDARRSPGDVRPRPQMGSANSDETVAVGTRRHVSILSVCVSACLRVCGSACLRVCVLSPPPRPAPVSGPSACPRDSDPADRSIGESADERRPWTGSPTAIPTAQARAPDRTTAAPFGTAAARSGDAILSEEPWGRIRSSCPGRSRGPHHRRCRRR